MSDRIIQGFSEMKNIYLTQILNEEKEEDYDNDGKEEPPKKEWKDSRNNKIRAAMGKPPEDDYEGDKYEDDEDEKPKSKKSKKEDDDMKTESFSNWRTDLYEVISKLETEPKVKDIGKEKVTERPVNNKITLNPTVTEKFAVIDTQELTEEFILEISNTAAKYFVNWGLNEHGLEMVIDYLGEEKFLEYVFYVAEDSILTEATQNKRTPAELKALEAKRKAINAESKQKHQEVLAKRMAQSKGDEAVKAAVSRQPETNSTPNTNKEKLKNVTRGIFATLAQSAREGIDRDIRARNARNAAKDSGKGLGGQIGAALKAAFYKPEFREWVERLIDEGYDLSNCTLGQLTERYEFLLEKATSEQQQKIFGLALSVKRGDVPRSKVSDKVLEIVDGMSETEIRKFASTKHKGLPHKKEE
jgi:Protein of unknwon function (DUF3008)